MEKRFLTHSEQIDYLINKKNLTVGNREYAEEMLCRIGYFGLICGYKAPYKDPRTGKYLDGTTFEDIVALYKFDENLRELFLKYILRFELNARSVISYRFSEKYGAGQSAYLSAESYSSDRSHRGDVKYLLRNFEKTVFESKNYSYITHYRKKYANVPFWILVNSLSIGVLAKFYKCMRDDVRESAAASFKGVSPAALDKYFSVITKFRNVCAHNDRLFCYRSPSDIPDTPLHGEYSIPRDINGYRMGKRDLFSVVIAFRYLLSGDDYDKFLLGLGNILRHFLRVSEHLPATVLLDTMGIPLSFAEKEMNIR
ncbi:MAG: Abi family protein [Clostridia bacterium]|nr:Abi family protein [Clostridia bacterium]